MIYTSKHACPCHLQILLLNLPCTFGHRYGSHCLPAFVVKGLRLGSSAITCASYDAQLHECMRSLMQGHSAYTSQGQPFDASGNVCGCDMSMRVPVSMGNPHCKRWQRSERSYYKEVRLWPLVAQKQLGLMLRDRLAVTKSSCGNMLIGTALHRTTVLSR